MTVFFSQLINGLSLGSIYALIALGYSMVYGIILLLNFAHGDVIMVGAYMSWFVMNQLGLGPVTAVCATILTCTLLGVVIEKVAYTPLRNAPRISLLITAIGVSFLFGVHRRADPGLRCQGHPGLLHQPDLPAGQGAPGPYLHHHPGGDGAVHAGAHLSGAKDQAWQGHAGGVGGYGRCPLMGINVNSTISFTFAVGSALAGIGSVLYCCSYPQATPTMGSMLGLRPLSPLFWAASAPSRAP